MIHPQALVDPGAMLAAGVEVGPFSVIGPDVKLASMIPCGHWNT